MSLKLALLGEPGVGKTTIVEMLQNRDAKNIPPTNGRVKHPVILDGLAIELHDVSGLDSYKSTQHEAVKECHGVILVYSPDYLHCHSVQELWKWYKLSQMWGTKPCVCVAYTRCLSMYLTPTPDLVSRALGALPKMRQFEVKYWAENAPAGVQKMFSTIAESVRDWLEQSDQGPLPGQRSEVSSFHLNHVSTLLATITESNFANVTAQQCIDGLNSECIKRLSRFHQLLQCDVGQEELSQETFLHKPGQAQYCLSFKSRSRLYYYREDHIEYYEKALQLLFANIISVAPFGGMEGVQSALKDSKDSLQRFKNEMMMEQHYYRSQRNLE